MSAEREPDYEAEMRLPEGATCDGCASAKRCFGFGFSTPGRTSCDFWPSRYRAPTQPPRCQACGQLDEPEIHDAALCPWMGGDPAISGGKT